MEPSRGARRGARLRGAIPRPIAPVPLPIVYYYRILLLMARGFEVFAGVTGFQWDEGNSEKNWRQHQVTQAEAEQVFFNHPLVVAPDPGHSNEETRHFALGRSNDGRHLTIVFTRRAGLIRVVSARPMSRRERKVYAQAESS